MLEIDYKGILCNTSTPKVSVDGICYTLLSRDFKDPIIVVYGEKDERSEVERKS